jgi:hypothetical protein
LPHLAAVLGAEIFMQRTVEYRGFEIHIDLESTSEDMFHGRAGFVLRGPSGGPGVAALGERIKIRGGPVFPADGLTSLRKLPTTPLLT